MVWQKEALNLSYSAVSSNLGIDQATVYRTVSMFRNTGTVEKRISLVSRESNRKLSQALELVIIHLVLQRPGIYLHEIANELLVTYGLEISLATICKFFKRVGFTRQKLRIAAVQKDDFLRSQFVSDIALFELIFFR